MGKTASHIAWRAAAAASRSSMTTTQQAWLSRLSRFRSTSKFTLPYNRLSVRPKALTILKWCLGKSRDSDYSNGTQFSLFWYGEDRFVLILKEGQKTLVFPAIFGKLTCKSYFFRKLIKHAFFHQIQILLIFSWIKLCCLGSRSVSDWYD